ncbi:MAG: hypothetical protein CME64_08660 [Halobacteriovoraceae bacterium]|nr:hypothetical protein [Halobacteriovoraceae bacterium]|tara:strand:- start:270894 stop:272702 length:1809 start_codon:yes stop_codon:yes gene_type:complete
MLEKLSKNNNIRLMKNGVYYIFEDGAPVLNYLELLSGKYAEDTFEDYISYRLGVTNKELSQDLKANIANKMREKLIRFKEGEDLVSDIKSDEDWLYMPTFLLLSQGGDDRSTIDPNTLKNKYHTSTLPLYDYQRSSCTSSSVSLETYLHIEQNHFELMAAHAIGELDKETLLHKQRDEIFSFYVSPLIKEKVSLISTPSGTDVEFLCTWLGLSRHEELFKKEHKKVCVFVNGDLEVGSGTKLAAGLNHFSGRAPIGHDLKKGENVVDDSNLDVIVQSFHTRDEQTNVINSKASEQKLYDKVKEQVEDDRVVVFHYVHASKTGVCIPSYDMAMKIKKDFGDKVVMIVDAAQMRLRSDSVEQYLELGMNVIVTGSKFIGGAPFSGALLLNEHDTKTLIESKMELPSEYDQYFDEFGINEIFKRSPSSKTWSNWGLYMRWEVALHEMKQFDSIPVEFSNLFILKWGKRVEKMIESGKFKVNILKESALLPSDDSSLSQANSIIPFEIETTPAFSQDQLKKIHAAMTVKRFPEDIVCEIGQPVQISTGDKKRFALRVALGAKNVTDAYRGTSSYNFDDCLEYLINNDQKLLNKLFDLVEEEVNANQ